MSPRWRTAILSGNGENIKAPLFFPLVNIPSAFCLGGHHVRQHSLWQTASKSYAHKVATCPVCSSRGPWFHFFEGHICPTSEPERGKVWHRCYREDRKVHWKEYGLWGQWEAASSLSFVAVNPCVAVGSTVAIWASVFWSVKWDCPHITSRVVVRNKGEDALSDSTLIKWHL